MTISDLLAIIQHSEPNKVLYLSLDSDPSKLYPILSCTISATVTPTPNTNPNQRGASIDLNLSNNILILHAVTKPNPP